MAATIAVAGATGNLGGRIVRSLLRRGADVHALVRDTGDSARVTRLERLGARVVTADMSSLPALTRACEGALCVVSALQGLRDVIVDAQSFLLEAAVAARVPRFIPSDYSIDFTKFPQGLNRNLDFRRLFHQRLDTAPIAATSVLIGAFLELLTSRMPILDLVAKRVSYWENADQRMDFTSIDDAAAFTAAAALDPSSPKVLRVAGSQVSARELAKIAGEAARADFELVRLGSLDELSALIEGDRAADPDGEKKPYPRWQANQYIHNMFSGRGKLEPLDNDRYPGLTWTGVRDVIPAN